MIVELWLFFVILSLALYTVGYYTKNDLLRILAVILLFSAGLQLDPVGGGVDLGLASHAQWNISNTVTPYNNITTVYTNYSSHLYGFYMMITALLSFVFIMFERHYAKKGNGD
jgi:hypothetical protein